jgi:transcriptional regulator with XRE-family HTH domain
MVRIPLSPEQRAVGQLLGAELRAARAGRPMHEVSAAAGISVETLRKIETGRIPTPSFATVAAVAGAVGVSLDALAALLQRPAVCAPPCSPFTTLTRRDVLASSPQSAPEDRASA